MTRRTVLIFAVIGLLAVVLVTVVSVGSPEPLAAPVRNTINVEQLYQDPARVSLPSFDDNYQRYIGILDVLRAYPVP